MDDGRRTRRIAEDERIRASEVRTIVVEDRKSEVALVLSIYLVSLLQLYYWIKSFP